MVDAPVEAMTFCTGEDKERRGKVYIRHVYIDYQIYINSFLTSGEVKLGCMFHREMGCPFLRKIYNYRGANLVLLA